MRKAAALYYSKYLNWMWDKDKLKRPIIVKENDHMTSFQPMNKISQLVVVSPFKFLSFWDY